MKLKDIFSKDRSQEIEYYEGSTQKWLPVKEFKDGVIVMKDGRYVKVIEVLPVNFYLKIGNGAAEYNLLLRKLFKDCTR